VFKANVPVRIDVHSDHNSHTLRDDIDLFVVDPTGMEVASDVRIDADCHVVFTPLQSGSYRVIVRNIGVVSNRSHVTIKQ
jgi:hypothetical protein